MPTIEVQGQRFQTNAELPAVGAAAPDALLVDRDLRDVRLHARLGETLLISAVPSLETPTCALSARKLNVRAAGLPAVRVLVISADLPFTQGRFALAEQLDALEMLSMMRDRSFAENYGLLIAEGPLAGLCARALLVIGPDARVAHARLVPDIAQEPDYDAALEAARRAAGAKPTAS